MSKLAKFILVVGAQLVLILIIILFKVAVLSGGTPVILKVEPVDPRDLLRGDYMVLRYQGVSRISSYYFDYSPINVGDTVYVPLRNYGSYWTARRGITKKLPTSEISGSVYIKGRVSQADSTGGRNSSEVSVLYNIEEYFIPEGTGWNPNWSASSDDVTVEVVVGDKGDAVLKQLYVNGDKWP